MSKKQEIAKALNKRARGMAISMLVAFLLLSFLSCNKKGGRMKIKKGQTWERVKFGDVHKFKFWSQKIKGEGDRTAGPSLEDWRKIIVLKPTGNPNTTFSMGFSDIFGNTKISNATRKIREGSFGMRMGNEDCDFFIASNDGEIGLEFEKYVDIEEEFDLVIH